MSLKEKLFKGILILFCMLLLTGSNAKALNNSNRRNNDHEIEVIVELYDAPVIELATMLKTRVNKLDVIMGKGYAEGRRTTLLKQQSAIISDAALIGVRGRVKYQYTNVFNGFSLTATEEQLSLLKKDRRIKKINYVTYYDAPVPAMIESNDFTQADIVHANGYTGESQVVAVIDTGIDWTHKDMVISPGAETKLGALDIPDGLPGEYFTEKIPYGYNYSDDDDEIIDLRPFSNMHGMHVAGIVGANGSVTGVAPNAQLLAMKVFGNDSGDTTTSSIILMKAIDDAIALGADVVNISLGAPSGNVDDSSVDQAAIQRAVDNGIVVACSAGNSSSYSSGDAVFVENPDIGVLGAPGLALPSIQVGSIEHTGAVTTGPALGIVANYSSWGTTPTLDFKPEISAPGSNIYSTLNDDRYGELSGTSMASPQVSGGTAVVFERLERSPLWDMNVITDAGGAVLAKNMLMSTAMPIREQIGMPYQTPRAQGAGSMNLDYAVRTEVIVVDEVTGISKVNGGEINGRTLSFTLEIINYGEDEHSYAMSAVTQTLKDDGDYSYPESAFIDSEIVFNLNGEGITEITVEGGTSIQVTIELTIDQGIFDGLTSTYINGFFYEGFVFFEPLEADLDLVPLSVPFISFVGDWTDSRAFDVTVYEDENIIGQRSFYDVDTGLVHWSPSGSYEILGNQEHQAAFSPNGDGLMDVIYPRYSLLRNLLDISYDIYRDTPTGLPVQHLESSTRQTKNYSTNYTAYTLTGKPSWDGEVSGFIQDGQYYYVISGLLADRVTEKSLVMPVLVDTVLPVLEGYEQIDKVLIIDAVDGGAGIASYILFDADTNEQLLVSAVDHIDLTLLDENVTAVYIGILDYAGNFLTDSQTIKVNHGPVLEPALSLDIENNQLLDNRQVTVEGTIYEVMSPSLKIDGVPVTLTLSGDTYTFSFEFNSLTDGKHTINFELYEGEDLVVSELRSLFIDTLLPTITSNNGDLFSVTNDLVVVGFDQTTYAPELTFEDGFPDLAVRINGITVYNVAVDYIADDSALKPAIYQYGEPWPLEHGENVFELSVTDGAGHEVTDSIIVMRDDVDETLTRAESLMITNGIEAEISVGETMTLIIEGILHNGEEVADFSGLVVSKSSEAVQVSGLLIEGSAIGTAQVTLTMDDAVAVITINVVAVEPKPESTPAPKPSTGGGGSIPSSPSVVVIEETVLPEGLNMFSLASYIDGYPGGMFKPDGLITRAEISKILAFVLILDSDKGTKFMDVPMTHWANGYVQAMADLKLIEGYGSGEFRPEANITRAELTTIMSRIIVNKELVALHAAVLPYTDMNDHWAREYVLRTYQRDIRLHDEMTLFKPDKALTRAEAVVMINQLIGRNSTEDLVDQSFVDVPQSYWAYKQIELASKE